MNYFTLEDDYLYCNNCEVQNKLHEVVIVTNTKTFFELECGVLRKPRVIRVYDNQPIYLRCHNCLCEEEISLERDLNGAKFY